MMQPENSPEYSVLDNFLAGNGFNYGLPAAPTFCSPSFSPTEFAEKHEPRNNCTASQNHKEAERKRRERINAHLHSLRSILLCNSKTDKASLLAKVVERVRELNEQTSEMLDQSFPCESDEISVCENKEEEDCFDGKRRVVVKASVCCEDRVDLIPDLIRVLKPLPLIPLRAEMVTLGGRMRSVMVFSGEVNRTDESALMLRDALTTLLVQRSKRPRLHV